MPRIEESKYKAVLKRDNTDSYEGRILTRSLSSRILRSKKATDFLPFIEDILYHWYNSVRLIKKSLNFRVEIDNKKIDG